MARSTLERNRRPISSALSRSFNADTGTCGDLPARADYSIGVGDFDVHLYSKKIANWAQDDWQVTNNLTLNLGCDTT